MVKEVLKKTIINNGITWQRETPVSELTGVKVIGITLCVPEEKAKFPIHKITLNRKGEVIAQENTPEWGEAFLTFPPAFKNIAEIAKWSCNLLKDCYGYGDIIEQRVRIIETF